MQVGYNLNLEQTQKLVMTPGLCQAINVLQLTSMELSTFIERQLEENPLLELREEEVEGERDFGSREKLRQNEKEKQDNGLNWEEYFEEYPPGGRYNRTDRQDQWLDKQENSYDRFLSKAPTLSDHLLSQLNLTPCSPKDRLIGEYLIGNIDSKGYLRVTLTEAAEQLNVASSDLERMLNTIQSFEPIGVGARNLQECLLIQISQLNLKNELIVKLVKDHLVDLAKGRLTCIAHKLGVTIREVQEAADLLKTLDPKPGRNFTSTNDTCYIVPDVVLEKVNGEYIILVNDVDVPRISINSTYRVALMKDKQIDASAKRFVESKLNAAVWLIRSIEQRRMTLYKVASCLVELQREFLERGIKYLKPLNLKTVAEIVGVHESTVSRATSNKYIQTPRGVFEMKSFFSTGLGSTAGAMTSAGSTKKILQEIINAEDKKYPLNDQKLVEQLRLKGIKISRRTVAKYRDELNIPSIQKRKRY
ncbi:MAG: RNA polymerase sigma-54 factor 1 [Pelotomaculum sp. PtaB.Bin104]|nr:MAG: RNA polymerase sigma-54 factor 1 [Pelotomaculum sp. PtaB.Bin104]